MKLELYVYDLLDRRGTKIDTLYMRIEYEVGAKDELWGYRGKAVTKIKCISKTEVKCVN